MHQGKLNSCQMTLDYSKLQIMHHVRVFQLCSSPGESGGGPQSNSTLNLGSSFTLQQPFLLWNFGETDEWHTSNRMGCVDPPIHFSISVFMHLFELCDNMKYRELLDSLLPCREAHPLCFPLSPLSHESIKLCVLALHRATSLWGFLGLFCLLC